MKIAKALKLKNRLAGEIARLKGIAQTKNVTEITQKPVYDVKNIVTAQLPFVIGNLVTVKTAVAMSNAGVTQENNTQTISSSAFWNIFMMAELKGMIETLRAIDTKDGTFNSAHGRFGEIATATPVTYVASLKQADIDSLVAKYEADIDSLQDLLDTHNATAEWTLLDKITI